MQMSSHSVTVRGPGEVEGGASRPLHLSALGWKLPRGLRPASFSWLYPPQRHSCGPLAVAPRWALPRALWVTAAALGAARTRSRPLAGEEAEAPPAWLVSPPPFTCAESPSPSSPEPSPVSSRASPNCPPRAGAGSHGMIPEVGGTLQVTQPSHRYGAWSSQHALEADLDPTCLHRGGD